MEIKNTLILLLFLVIFSCSQVENRLSETSGDKNHIEINDERIIELIKDYCKDQELVRGKSVVLLMLEMLGSRKIYSIQKIPKFSLEKHVNYSIVDGYLVIIYSPLDSFKEKISDSITFNDQKNKFESLGYFDDLAKNDLYNPLVWRAIECDDSFEIKKSKGTIDYFVPCDYIIKPSEIKFDSIYLDKIK
ncbi:MAG: hypothetical protein RIM99_19715 [Cyclobacteriaceae bacterium]